MLNKVFSFFRRHHHINWALADQAMVSGVNFLTGLMLARFLGIEEFGRFTLIWMAVLFVNSFMNALIISPLMSIGPKQDKTNAPAYFGATFLQQFIFSLATFGLLFAGVHLSGFVFPEWRVGALALPLASAALAFQFQDFIRRYFFTRGKVIAAVTSDAIRYVGQLALLVWLFLSVPENMNTAWVLWVIAGTGAFGVLASIPGIKGIRWERKVFSKILVRHWVFARWLVGTALTKWAMGNLLIIVAGGVFGAAAVGALQAAKNLMGVTRPLFMGLENVIPVQASLRLHENGAKALARYLKKVTILGGLATALIAFIAIVTPEFWLNLVYGPKYAGYGYLLQLFAALSILTFIAQPIQHGLRALEKTKPIFTISLAAGVFSVLAAYPLVKLMGLSGVPVGNIIIDLFLIMGLCVVLSRELKLQNKGQK